MPNSFFTRMTMKHRKDDLTNAIQPDKSTIEQTLTDWDRDRSSMFFVNQQGIEKSFASIFEENGIKTGHNSVTEKKLMEIWDKTFFKGEKEAIEILDNNRTVTKGEQRVAFENEYLSKSDNLKTMRNHMKYFMNQKGYTWITQNAIAAVNSKKAVDPYNEDVLRLFESGAVDRKMFFSVVDGEIHIKERYVYKAINITTNLSNGLTKMETIVGDEKTGLMTATGEYVLVIDKATGEPKCSVKNVTLEHHNDITKEMFDERSIFEKITGFLKNVYEAAKESFLSKKNENAQEGHIIGNPTAVVHVTKIDKEESQNEIKPFV